MLNNIKFNRVVHEHVVLLTVVTREQPRIHLVETLTVTPVCEGIVRVVAQIGFMEKPNITEILREAEAHGVPYEPECTTFFLSREELLRGQRSDLPPLRRRGVHADGTRRAGDRRLLWLAAQPSHRNRDAARDLIPARPQKRRPPDADRHLR